MLRLFRATPPARTPSRVQQLVKQPTHTGGRHFESQTRPGLQQRYGNRLRSTPKPLSGTSARWCLLGDSLKEVGERRVGVCDPSSSFVEQLRCDVYGLLGNQIGVDLICGHVVRA